MGIYDREYYRDRSGGLSWFAGPYPAVRTIILVNVLVFIVQVLFDGRGAMQDALSANSDAILHRFEFWRLWTSAFLHSRSNLFHIVWNMWFLWMVGRDLEQQLGSREFSLTYLAGCGFSMLGWTVLDSLGQNHGVANAVGASGAVMTILTIYTLYYPRREILLFFILPAPMWIALIVFLASDIYGLLQVFQGASAAGTRVAFAGHLAGALYGLAYWFFGLRWSQLVRFRPGWPRLRVVSPPEIRGERKPRPRESVSTPAPRAAAAGGTPRLAATPAIPESELDERLDEVLAKIAREGRAGLTDEEKSILEEASKRARSKRNVRP